MFATASAAANGTPWSAQAVATAKASRCSTAAPDSRASRDASASDVVTASVVAMSSTRAPAAATAALIAAWASTRADIGSGNAASSSMTAGSTSRVDRATTMSPVARFVPGYAPHVPTRITARGRQRASLAAVPLAAATIPMPTGRAATTRLPTVAFIAAPRSPWSPTSSGANAATTRRSQVS